MIKEGNSVLIDDLPEPSRFNWMVIRVSLVSRLIRACRTCMGTVKQTATEKTKRKRTAPPPATQGTESKLAGHW